MAEKGMKQASFQLAQGYTWGEEAGSVWGVGHQVCVFKPLPRIPHFVNANLYFVVSVSCNVRLFSFLLLQS